ncbi:excalibur calcium-binding domain-containing protein [Actinomadura sp. 9N215]|uniref:excalibur calcium-binding domain-containing protein n=1 Tax=Actinomadura sp. 9N215 TaxID=3375150 RepID=UPI0037B837D6
MPEPSHPPPGRAAHPRLRFRFRGRRPRRRGLLPVLAALAAILLLGFLTSCGSDSEDAEKTAPRETSAPPASPPPTPPTPAPREPRDPSTPLPGAADGVDPRFATCAEANAHGYGPYVKGWDPEYSWYHDRDHDGVDCEPGAVAPPGPADGLDPRFDTCAEANAHGYGPYYRGVDPEYDWYQDRDHDGIDCEPGFGGTPPSDEPTEEPSTPPSEPPSEEPSDVPSDVPSEEPSEPSEPPSDPGPSEPGTSEEPSAPNSGG